MLFQLGNAEERNAENPDRFFIPEAAERATLQPGDFAKLIFLPEDGDGGERMWVEIYEVLGTGVYLGTLANNPFTIELEHGDAVAFKAEHIIDINRS